MDAKLKTAIWDRMVETDRLARYYGRLAGKLARKKVASIVTTSFSVASAYSIANSLVSCSAHPTNSSIMSLRHGHGVVVVDLSPRRHSYPHPQSHSVAVPIW